MFPLQGIGLQWPRHPPVCEHTFVSVKGSSYARFQRALRLGQLDQIRDAAAELPRVDLVDALAVCLLMSAQRDPRYDRAATRWLARFALERRDVTLADVRAAVAALNALPSDPVAGRQALAALCSAHGLARAARLAGPA
jgi:hypothetical protein